MQIRKDNACVVQCTRCPMPNKKNRCGQCMHCPYNGFFCAQNKTRTCTYLRILFPETSASTNSATWADFKKNDF